MTQTRSGLVPAKIYEADDSSHVVHFMFNPQQYEISLEHKYKERGMGGNKPTIELINIGRQTLVLPKIIFDTYEAGSDVTGQTNLLWDLMDPVVESGDPKPHPRVAIFEWGTFSYKCYIRRVSQKFILFTPEGTPVRAEVTIDLQQYVEELPRQNPTSGGGPVERVWSIKAGDRIDAIAATVYDDATLWRLIAEHNNLNNPSRLPIGMELGIPPKDGA